jgi:hypothetical protein
MHTTDDGGAPIARISEGMRAIDRAGDDVGIVKLARMDDPQAVTPKVRTAAPARWRT